jgi:poly-gamma-glutamate synthesis protein (capsule biosynthesis protein)
VPFRILALLAVTAAMALAGRAQAADPVFHGSIAVLTPEQKAEMRGRSWHEGCPVGLRDLRRLTVDFWGFGGGLRTGRLIVHETQAWRIKRVFRRLFYAGFRIRRMVPIDAYDGKDRRSMEANNTSGFNCRFVSGTTRWSQHAYGKAIDINPVQNPYVSGSFVSPTAGAPFADRTKQSRGMIHGGDKVVRAFADANWRWGGYWSSYKDYMHFSRTGT